MEGNRTRTLGRRALLAGGAAGVAAAAAQAIAAPAKVLASDHDPLKIGEYNSGSTATSLGAPSSDGLVVSSGGGDGLIGGSTVGAKSGVYGFSTSASGNAVLGLNTSSDNRGALGGPDNGVWGEGHKQGNGGVHGTHLLAHSPGVTGDNAVDNTYGALGGVFGVEAAAPDSLWALGVMGKAAFSRSGILTIGTNKQYARVSGLALTGDSFVVATLLQYRSGIWVAAAVPSVAGRSITIYLNKKVTSAIKVGWIVLERFPWI